MTLPTSHPGPSALWAHIRWLRWSFHCPHPTTVFGSPSLQGMSMLGSGGHEGPSCLWRAGENNYIHLCPQTPMPSLHPTTHPSPCPSPCCNPSALYSPTWVLPTRPQVSTRFQLLGTMLCSQPGLSAQTEGNQALSPVLSREAGIGGGRDASPWYLWSPFHLLHPPSSPTDPGICSGHVTWIPSP